MQNVQLKASFVTKHFFANTIATIHGTLNPSAPNLQISKHMPYPTQTFLAIIHSDLHPVHPYSFRVRKIQFDREKNSLRKEFEVRPAKDSAHEVSPQARNQFHHPSRSRQATSRIQFCLSSSRNKTTQTSRSTTNAPVCHPAAVTEKQNLSFRVFRP